MKILPTAIRIARWGAWIGLACGVVYSFGGLIVDLLTIGLNRGTLLAFGALIGMPVIFGVAGFFLGALLALMAGVIRAVLHRREQPEE